MNAVTIDNGVYWQSVSPQTFSTAFVEWLQQCEVRLRLAGTTPFCQSTTLEKCLESPDNGNEAVGGDCYRIAFVIFKLKNALFVP